MADSKKYNGSTWEHSLRKLTTSTDTFTTLPVDVYADGNNATVGLQGNMSQTGTPTPDNPIIPQGTGEMTGNLFDYVAYFDSTFTAYNQFFNYATVQLKPNTTYTLSTSIIEQGSNPRNTAFIVATTNQTPTTASGGLSNVSPITITTESDGVLKLYKRISGSGVIPTKAVFDNGDWIMLNSGSTALPFEPSGYKIPISSVSTTTPVYLGEVQTTRQIKKLVLTGEETIRLQSINEYNIANFYINIVSVAKDGLSSHFEKQTTTIGQTQTEGFLLAVSAGSTSTTLYMRTSTSRASTTTEMQTWLSNQYTNGTPVTFWYTTEDTTTGIVNEPLRKIGDYADTVSGITIPTITGKDTFDVLTTLKPSEVSLAYTGWHDATVKEWDGSEWQ